MPFRIQPGLVIALGLLLAPLVGGCERAATHPALAEADFPALIPAWEFVFERNALGGFSFSPDGAKLAWSGVRGWRRGLNVRHADGTVHFYRVGGSGMYWSADSRRLLILHDSTGAENHHLYRLDVDDPEAEPKDLTPYPGVRVWLYRIVESDPRHVLVLHNRRSATVRDLYRIDLDTGAEVLVAKNPGDGIAPQVDADGKFLGWRRAGPTARLRSRPRPPELKARSALSRRGHDVQRAVGIAPDRSSAWVLSNRGRERVALFEVDTASGAVKLVHQDPDVDVTGVVTSRRTGKPLLVSAQADYPRTRILDAALAADLAPLLNAHAGTRFGFEIEAMDASERRAVVSLFTHATRRYYLLDRDRGTHVLLGKTRDAQFEQALTIPEAVQFRARDGMVIPGYLVRPAGTRGAQVPLVVLVHGGPWSRVVWSDPDHDGDLLRAHFLANRGYAVLAINFRGSVGYGRSFATAAVGEMGARMQSDLIDGARWAIEAGIADPARIAIMGYSYGGYAVLMALAQQPRLFACGVDIAGPTDLVGLIENFPAYWELELDHWYSYVGDPAVPEDRSRMQAASPLAWADKIERPVLIVQGENDVRVRPGQSARLVQMLREAGKPVRYVTLTDMGHSLSYWAHHLRILRETEAFLGDCLGGRSARFDLLEWAARLTGRLPLVY